MLSISLFIIITSINISGDSITDTYGNLIFPIEINVIHRGIQQTLTFICLVASTARISTLADAYAREKQKGIKKCAPQKPQMTRVLMATQTHFASGAQQLIIAHENEAL